ncbi:SIS domain-containing protein [Paenactinomyces guangxiensis]|uniref:UPF0309 protein H1191_04395 n=1 Tax=Paenactinomyces guangxiensis TaxID=1490290 RepID=A0A7W1WPJ3_9BACL|nr:SIS domain-containing protein [Paenactinomyces guangxiensis]MBA4493541.1 SIS domain-containing protein [Paenactinomyces guangxiensis]MBH8590632.1 SIS domain-containing protein [Paenactinomyces guangxiensis]
MLQTYLNKVKELLDVIEKNELDHMKQAAQKVAEAIQKGGIIHLFGCGHSHILTEEVFYRAGGLVPIHPILHEPLMLHEGAVRSSQLERKNNYAELFLKDHDIREHDICFVLSTSGRNPVPVDVANHFRQKGVFVIGITSITYSSSQPSRHQSGKHLFDSVDIVIDNHSPIGDAVLTHEQVKVPFTPTSTVIGATILNAIFSEAITIMAENGFEPPVFLSGNINGADEHNNQLIAKYADRIPLLTLNLEG